MEETTIQNPELDKLNEQLEQMAAHLEALAHEDDIEPTIRKVSDLKPAFYFVVEKKNQLTLKEFKKAGGEIEEFEAPRHPAEGKFKELLNIYNIHKQKFRDNQKEQLKLNLKKKNEVLEELKNLINEEERIGTAFQKFKDLQEKWRSIGDVPPQKYRSLQKDYTAQVDLFYYNININKELKEHDLKKNKLLREEIIKKLQELLNNESINTIQQLIWEYELDWDNIGPTSQEDYTRLKEEYSELRKSIYKKIEDFHLDRKEHEKANLESKAVLVQKIKELADNSGNSPKSWMDNTDEIQNIREEWKKIGFATKKENNIVWQEFKAAIDEFFEKKKKFFEGLKEEKSERRTKKQELCEQAEKLSKNTDWKKTTDDFIQLQKQWKNIGPISHRDDRKTWERFKAACDVFFIAKKEYYATEDERQEKNLEKKEALVAKIRETKFGEDQALNREILNQYVEEWNNIEHVPFKQKNRMQNEFNKALDEKYDQLKIDKMEREMMKFRDKIERLKAARDGKERLKREYDFLREKIKILEASTIQYENNLGFFTNAKGDNPFIKEAEKKIEKSRKELDILKRKLNFTNRALQPAKKERAE